MLFEVLVSILAGFGCFMWGAFSSVFLRTIDHSLLAYIFVFLMWGIIPAIAVLTLWREGANLLPIVIIFSYLFGWMKASESMKEEP